MWWRGVAQPYFQDSKLLSEGQILQKQVASETKKASGQKRQQD